MIKARPLPMLATAASVFVVLLLVLRVLQGNGVVVPPPPILPVLVGAFAVVLLVLGWRMRGYVAGKSSMDPIAASRVAALAVSGAFVGAAMTGAGLAQVVALLDQLGAAAARADVVVGSVTALLAAGLAVIALVVQRWCEVPDDDDPASPPGATT